jgi:hypothetical protein
MRHHEIAQRLRKTDAYVIELRKRGIVADGVQNISAEEWATLAASIGQKRPGPKTIAMIEQQLRALQAPLADAFARLRKGRAA